MFPKSPSKFVFVDMRDCHPWNNHKLCNWNVSIFSFIFLSRFFFFFAVIEEKLQWDANGIGIEAIGEGGNIDLWQMLLGNPAQNENLQFTLGSVRFGSAWLMSEVKGLIHRSASLTRSFIWFSLKEIKWHTVIHHRENITPIKKITYRTNIPVVYSCVHSTWW